MASRIFRCIWLLCYKATWGLRQNLLQPFWLLINSYCAPKHHHFSVLTENNPRKIYKLSLFCLPLQRIPFSLTPCWGILSRSKAITHAETDGWWDKVSRHIYKGVYLTLCSWRIETSQLSGVVLSIAMVDALGMCNNHIPLLVWVYCILQYAKYW